jgi:triacylglycerol lipase
MKKGSIEMSLPVSFSKGLALFLAECCLQAYNQLNFKSIFSIPEGYTLIGPIVAAPLKVLDFHGLLDCYGFIIESPDSIVISFRGSRTNPDWIADASIKQTYFPYTRIKLGIHSGFAEVYKACREKIIDTLNKLDSSKQLYITGHSLGGALAVLCALDTAVNTAFTDPVMYNFGSPRVGNPKFVQSYNEIISNSVRIVNTNDIVALLPPAAVRPPFSNQLLYYRHVKELVTITVQTGSIAGNHLMDAYISGLKAMP